MSFTKIPGSYTPNGKKMTPRNCIWLNTMYCTIDWEFFAVDIGAFIDSARYVIDQLDCELYFKIRKTTSTTFSVGLHRVFKNENERPDDGFILHLILSVVGLGKQRKDEYMDSSTDDLLVSYDVSALELDKTKRHCWVVKCYLEMCEITTLDNEAFKEQNKLLERIKKRKKNMMSKLSAIAYLLSCPEFDSVFSGRQTYEFAQIKAELIERTVEFSDEILGGVVSRGCIAGAPFVRRTELAKILGYIYSKKFRCIEDEEILRLFCMAYRYGLLYLKGDCIEYMRDHLQDTDFLINVLVFCDMLCDNSPLMRTALYELLDRKKEILETAKWKNLADAANPVLRSIIETLTLKVKGEGLLEEDVSTKYSREHLEKMMVELDEAIKSMGPLKDEHKGKKNSRK